MGHKTRILVTGAGGYIGTVVSYYLLKAGYNLVAIDNFSGGYLEPLELLRKSFGKRRILIIKSDLTKKPKNLFTRVGRVDVVIHLAGHCSVNESIENPSKYFLNNTLASQILIGSLFKNGIKKIIFSSSCTVYGNSEKFRIKENQPTNPTSPYALSKLATEQMIYWYGKAKELDYVVLRYFNVCGASQDAKFGDSKRPSVHLIQNLVRAALGLEDFFLTYKKVNTKDGSPIRDYLDVVDLATAHLKALRYLMAGGKSEFINLGSGKGCSVLEAIKKVEKYFHIKIPTARKKTRKGENDNSIASINKAEKILGWRPKRDITKSIATLAEWYKSRPQGWSY